MTLRPGFMVAALIVAHGLDLATFWMALALYGVPLEAERNILMVGAYGIGGFGMVAATEVALVAVAVSLLARITTRPVWPIFLLFYAFGLLGMAENLLAIHSFGGI